MFFFAICFQHPHFHRLSPGETTRVTGDSFFTPVERAAVWRRKSHLGPMVWCDSRMQLDLDVSVIYLDVSGCIWKKTMNWWIWGSAKPWSTGSAISGAHLYTSNKTQRLSPQARKIGKRAMLGAGEAVVFWCISHVHHVDVVRNMLETSTVPFITTNVDASIIWNSVKSLRVDQVCK